MLLPTRKGRVVSAISEIRRLLPREEPDPQVLRSESLKLYRGIVRSIFRAPPSQVRTETYNHARGEFERNRHLTDTNAIEHCIHQGSSQYKALSHYFEEQRHFAKPLLVKEFPEKRVETLKSWLKVTPLDKRARVKMLLRLAERRVERHNDLRLLLERAEAASGRQWRSLEYEWTGLLRQMQKRVDMEKDGIGG